MITVVAGSWGVGKTYWIAKQLAARSEALPPALYIAPATVGVDAHRLQLEMPQLRIETVLPEAVQMVEQQQIYLEIGHHLSPDLPWLAQFPHRRVAIVSADQVAGSAQTDQATQIDWHEWADEVVTSAVPCLETTDILPETDTFVFWQAPLRGQVLDPGSLHTFWQELVQGAYGHLIRAKAFLELADGQAIYVDHLLGQATTYEDLPLPKWLEGRPQRFSGIEMVGQQLNQPLIAQTLRDCCLPDSLLTSHQAMLRQNQSLQSPGYPALTPQQAA